MKTERFKTKIYDIIPFEPVLECASAEEVADRWSEDAWITQFEAEYATA